MSVSIHQRAPYVRSILAPAIILGLVILLTVLAVKATQTAAVSGAEEGRVATQPLEGGGRVVYGEPIAMP